MCCATLNSLVVSPVAYQITGFRAYLRMFGNIGITFTVKTSLENTSC